MIRVSALCLVALVSCVTGQASTRYNFTVEENNPVNQLVGQIRTKLGYRYQFVTPSDLFSLDPESGIIRTKTRIDREVVGDVVDLIVLGRRDSTGAMDLTIAINVRIRDVNDNSPTFTPSWKEWRVNENAPVDRTYFNLPQARDPDTGANRVTQNYRISSGNSDGTFRLDVSDVQLLLRLAKPLDRESNSSFHLVVTVADGGNPPRSGSMRVTVVVLDTNDNSPVFTPSRYMPRLNETAPVGTVLVQVTATDADEGRNSEITYSFDETGMTSLDEFVIDPRLGIIRLTQPFTCYKAGDGSSCSLVVVARDGGTKPRSAFCYVTVVVADDNDHAPALTVYFAASGPDGGGVVSETALPGARVAFVKAVDKDKGRNGNVTLSIAGGDGHFRLKPQALAGYFRLDVARVFTSSSPRQFTLQLRAEDQGVPPKSTTVTEKISLTKANRHRPVFVQSNVTAILREDALLGTFVASMRASDEDQGLNGKLIYRITSGDASGRFRIDGDTGLVTLAAALDYETAPSYAMNISVSDSGPSPLKAFARLHVRVLDLNDEKPLFAKSSTTVTVLENVAPPSTILRLTATDRDSGRNGSITYTLLPPFSEAYRDTFAVSGRDLRLLKSLDAESKASYLLEVEAKDGGSPALSSTLTVTVRVSNVDDESPVLYPSTYFARDVAGHNQGALIVRLRASDPDGQPPTFSLVSGGGFTVNSVTGDVTRTSWPGLSLASLTVQATDGAGHNSAYGTVLVFPATFGSSPAFSQSIYNFSLAEGGAAGQLVGQVSISGADSLYITDGDPSGFFSISTDGRITATTALDRDKVSAFLLTVTAQFSRDFSVCQVAIHLLDVNDNAPLFEWPSYHVQVARDAAVGAEIGAAIARDPDQDSNGTLTYSLSNATFIKINASTGALFLIKPVSTWSPTPIALTVTALDGRGRSAVVPLSVGVRSGPAPVSPSFAKPEYTFVVSEADPVHFVVARLSAGEGAVMSWRGAEPQAKFGIFPDGAVYVARPLDREEREDYLYTVVAKDRSYPGHSATAQVTLTLSDVNDNAPVFAHALYSFSVLEDLPMGSLVGRVTAVDADNGEHALVSYRVDPSFPTSDFTVSVTSGEIRTARVFDREASPGNVFNFRVFGEDRGGLKGSTEVRVTVADANDHAPTFPAALMEATVVEDAALGTTVKRVTASDGDTGTNAVIHYSIISGNEAGVFNIDSKNGRVFLARELDRERTDRYRLTIEGRDIPGLSSTTVLLVTVADANDNSPIFVNFTSGSAILREGTEPGSVVAQFYATDSDRGNNARIVFRIVSGDPDHLFGLDPGRGILYLRRPLDFETRQTLHLKIEARDRGSPEQRAAEKTFTIRVLDDNDNPPRFPVNTPLIGRVNETATDWTLRIHAVDNDRTSPNNQISYRLVRANPASGIKDFTLDAVTGVLRVSRPPLDREKTSTYQLTVEAVDHGSPRLTSTGSVVVVMVEDADDEQPQILTQEGILLPQSLSVGSSMARLRARDRDIGSHARLVFQLRSPEDGSVRLVGSDLQLGKSLAPSLLDIPVVWSVGNPGRSPVVANVTLLLQSKDESGLRFQETSYTAEVTENGPTNALLTTIRALYPGSPVSQLKYWITGVFAGNRSVAQPRGLFSIGRESGQLRSGAVPLDREASPTGTYEVDVTVQDAGSKLPRTRTTTVYVSVKDENDAPPVFDPNYVEIRVMEGISRLPDTLFTFSAHDPDLGPGLTYSLTDNVNATFAMDAATGRLSLLKSLDHETRPAYHLTVSVSDSVHTADCSVLVRVVDVNDNAPVFSLSPPVYALSIREGAPPDSWLGQVAATDPDSANNGRVSYELVNGKLAPEFSLDAGSGVLTTTRELDFETTSHYLLLVRAKDAGSPFPLSATATVLVNVQDANDNAPLFDLSQYRAAIPESLPVNSPVLRVRATDRDYGKNARISYSLSSPLPLPFAINPASGEVSLRSGMDRERQSSFSFLALAFDGENRGEAQVLVTVQDVNDCAPRWVSSNVTSVKENVAPLSFHRLVCADEDQNSTLAYSLSPAAGFDLVGQWLRVETPQDRERRREVSLRVSCSDGLHSADQRILVRIVDAEEHAPVFSPSSYSLTVSGRTVTLGATLLQLRATDEDEGDVRFFMTPSAPALDLSLDPVSGALSFRRSPRLAEYRVAARAVNLVRGGVGEAPIVIRVSPAAPCHPRFTRDVFLFTVGEGWTGDVGRVMAQSCANASLSYVVLRGDTDFLEVSDTSGVVRVVRALDAGRQATVTLLAFDPAASDAKPTTRVTVRALDVNDHRPRCSARPLVAQVSEDSRVGTLVAIVTASDPDTGPLSFRLADTGPSPLRINSSTGHVTLSQPLDREQHEQYRALVLVTDAGHVPFTVTCTLSVFVTDVNDNSPAPAATSFEFDVHPDISVGTLIGGVLAYDPDAGQNGSLSYSSDSTQFGVGLTTGLIRLSAALPRSRTQFVFAVRIQDGGGLAVSVNVRVTVVSSSLLSFTAPTGPVSVSESAPPFSLVTTFSTGASSPTFRLLAVSPSSVRRSSFTASGYSGTDFLLESATGRLLVGAGGLDAERASEYRVLVRAGSGTSFGDQETVISVTDRVDATPRFTHRVYRFSVSEEAAVGRKVGSVSAAVGDTGSAVRFSLASSSSPFLINPDSGEITVAASLDVETRASYQLTVHASNTRNSALAASAFVLVAVQDANDNYPAFTQNVFVAEVAENAPIGTLVVVCNATDKDVTQHVLRYSFISRTTKFAIDPFTGRVTVAAALDREKTAKYELGVKVTDGEKPYTTELIIKVTDVNDQTPVFSKPLYNFVVVSSSSRIAVGEVTATDSDEASSPNSRLSYSLHGPAASLFLMESSTGRFFSRERLPADANYTLRARAIDSGRPQLTGETQLTVRVVESERPTIDDSWSNRLQAVPNSLEVGTQVVRVNASSPLGLPLIFSITGGNGSAHFSVDSSTGWINLTSSLLTSQGKWFRVSVTAFATNASSSIPSRRSANVTFVVTSSNSRRPELSSTRTSMTVSESVAVNTTLFRIAVSDGDEGLNGAVSLRLLPPDGPFALVPTEDGYAVSVRRPLDFETARTHELEVKASDKAFYPLTASLTLRVTVLDVNDNKPLFQRAVYSVHVKENSRAGIPLITVRAEDRDGSGHNAVQYSVVSGEDLVAIGRDTGVVTLRAANLDYETRRNHSAVLLATNPDDPTKRSTAELLLQVESVDEFRPVCLKSSATFRIKEAAVAGQEVGQVVAVDEDRGIHGRIRYQLVGTEPPGVRSFSVNADSGKVLVAEPLDRETRSRVVLHVLASNPGPLTAGGSVCEVTIEIQDGNDAPRFLKAVYSTSVLESAAAGSAVIRVVAEERDVALRDRTVRYSLRDVSGALIIDPDTGEVKVGARGIDRETHAAFNITVVATDEGTPPLAGTALLLVEVLDVNDNGPRFQPSHPRFVIQEGVGSGALVGSLTSFTHDADGPGNGAPFAFSLLPSSSSSSFRMSPDGRVFTRRRLDREEMASASLLVLVSDSGTPPRTSTLAFTVAVADVNDSPSSARRLHLLLAWPSSESHLEGPVAVLRPADPDTSGQYHCSVVSLPASFLLHSDCSLYAMGPPPANDKEYEARVSHHDGKHASVESVVQISVFRVTPEDIAQRSVFLRLAGSIESSTLLSRLSALLEAGRLDGGLARLVPVQLRGDGVVVVSELSAAALVARLQPSLAILTLRSSLRVVAALGSPCDATLTPCSGHASQCLARRVFARGQPMATWDGLTTAVSSGALSWAASCQCDSGWAGDSCALSTAGCPAGLCLNGGTCHSAGVCLCPSGWSGVRCDLEEKPCRAGAVCVHGQCTETSPGHRCTCHLGWTGPRCDTPTDACSSKPCRNGGTCHRLLGAYRCACPFGTFGAQCEGQAQGFTEGSFAVFSLSDFARYSLTLELATMQSDALLLYHQVTKDWHLSLSLRSGRPTLQLYRGFQAPLAVTVPVRAEPPGSWLRLTLVKSESALKLAADLCNRTVWSAAGKDEAGCPNTVCTDARCARDFIIPATDREKLSRPSNKQFFIGGLPSGTLSLPGLTSFDLVGCLRRLAGFSSSQPSRSSGLLASCPRSSPLSLCSASRVCGVAAARCYDEWFTARCECPADHQPPSCTPGFKGYSLTPGSMIVYTLRPGTLRREGGVRRRRSITTRTSTLSLRLTTSASSGVLMHAKTSSEDYTLLMLSESQLVVQQAVGSSVFTLVHPARHLSNGLIHAVALIVHVNNGTISLSVDDALHSGTALTGHNFLEASQMSVGGALDDTKWQGAAAPGFVGCLSQLRFNGAVQPLSDALAARYNVTVVGRVSGSCPVEACRSYRCAEGHRCVNRPEQGWGRAECLADDSAAAAVNLLLVVLLPVCLLLAIVAVGVVTWMCLLRRRHGAPCKRAWPAASFPGPKSSVGGGSGRQLADLVFLPGSGREDGPVPPVPPERVAMETLAFNPKVPGTDSTRSTKSFPDSGFQDQRLTRLPSDSVMMLCGPSSSADDQLSLPDTEDPYELGPPEQYDLDNASSIAPSDVDVTRHYRHYRRRPPARLPPHAEVPAPPLSPEGTESGSRLYERLGSQSSATSHDTGPRYPYAYRHRLPAPRPMPSTAVGRGLTLDDVRRLNRQPAAFHAPMTLQTRGQHSTTGSSSAGGSREQFLPLGSRSHSSRHSMPLRPGDSSSDDDGMDSAGGSFTCSEGEDQPSAGQVNRAFAAAAALRHAATPHGHNLVPDQGLPSELDALLRWEPNFNSLIGVFEDLAGLPVQRLKPPSEEFV